MISELINKAFWNTATDRTVRKESLKENVQRDDYSIVKLDVDEAYVILSELSDYVGAERGFKAEILELDKLDDEEQQEVVEEFIVNNRKQYLEDVATLIRTQKMVEMVLEFCKEYEKEPPEWLKEAEAKEGLQLSINHYNETEFRAWAERILNRRRGTN
jgi:hypothetical protein